MNPLISVIIPTYNEEKYIQDTLEHILNSTYKNYEIITVLNGCKDRTRKVVQKYPKVKIIETEKKGVSLARNLGAKNAKGDILFFLDADAKIKKNALNQIVTHLKKQHSVGRILIKPDLKKPKYILLLNFKNLIAYLNINHATGANIFCPKSIFEKCNGFDEKLDFKEDRKFIKQALRYGKFCLIKNSYCIVSMRRYENMNLLKLALYWLILRWLGVKYQNFR